jgi:hypothetical protein
MFSHGTPHTSKYAPASPLSISKISLFVSTASDNIHSFSAPVIVNVSESLSF